MLWGTVWHGKSHGPARRDEDCRHNGAGSCDHQRSPRGGKKKANRSSPTFSTRLGESSRRRPKRRASKEYPE
jgi:hypothetical protein